MINQHFALNERCYSLIFIFSNVLEYNTCSENEKKKCTSTAISTENRVSLDDCKYLCDQNENCKFIFWNTGLFCSLHDTCDDYKTPKKAKVGGHILAKESCSGTM